MEPIIKKLFDAGADNYDWQRKHLIPCFDNFYGMALSLVHTEAVLPRILDVGAEAGLFASFVLQKYPDAQMTLIDYSEKMLSGARQRFGEVPNIQYSVADYSTFSFTDTYNIHSL